MSEHARTVEACRVVTGKQWVIRFKFEVKAKVIGGRKPNDKLTRVQMTSVDRFETVFVRVSDSAPVGEH